MEIFDTLISVFDFIYSLLDTIIQGIYGVIKIVSSLLELMISIARILPNPLYACFISFITLYGVIFTYKIFRKG